jgi:hypothetical protein
MAKRTGKQAGGTRQPGKLTLIHLDRIEHAYDNSKSVSSSPDQAMDIRRQ